MDRLYGDLWGRVGPPNPRVPVSGASEALLHEIFPPITTENVSGRLKTIRNKTAAAIDGLLKKHLLIPGLSTKVAMLFNMLYYSSSFPTVSKENRTTLIPKAGKNISKVKNWRPFTIGPISSRICSSILSSRVRKDIELNLRQNGFTSGCKINVDLISAALNYCKRDKDGVFTIVDISKVFDTILHSACLARKGIPAPTTPSMSFSISQSGYMRRRSQKTTLSRH